MTGSLRLTLAAMLIAGVFGFAQQIPPGTVLPVMLRSGIDARHDKPGKDVTGKIMQDVRLPDGQMIPRGTKIRGQIVRAQPASAGTPSQLIVKFDRVVAKNGPIPVTTHLRALASANEVYEARMPTNAWDDYGTSPSDWNTVQIGGAGVYRGSGQVVENSHVVGTTTDYGAVTAKVTAAADRGCYGTSAEDQALWKFSPWACGVYGLPGLKIVRSDESSGAGEIVLESDRDVRIRGGSGWLLRVGPPAGPASTH